MIGAKGIAAPHIQGGGIERHVELLSSHLSSRGHTVTVYVRNYSNPDRRKRWNDVRLQTMWTVRLQSFDTIIYTILATLHVLTQDVDIVHYHGVGPATLSWIPRLFKRKSRVVVTFHSRDRFQDKWGMFAKAYLAFGEWAACRFPHLTIAVSHGIKLFCQQLYQRLAVYIPNGVDVPSRIPEPTLLERMGLQPDEYIITLGRLIPLKANEDVIRAYRGLETTKKLVIIGEPSAFDVPYQLMLEELAQKDPRVLLVGFREGDELKQLIAHCYCMVHPSRVEGLSVAILEAMSYGKLVVMSDIEANRELVDHSGVAYPSGNVKKLQETLQWLFSDPILVRVRGERARDVVKRLYSWDHVVRRIEREYLKLFERD